MWHILYRAGRRRPSVGRFHELGAARHRCRGFGRSKRDRPEETRSAFIFARRLARPRPKVTKQNISALIDAVPPDGLVLVVGGGSRGEGTEALYTSTKFDLVAFDIYLSKDVDVIADGHQMPFRDQTFDAIVVQAVLEHVLDPTQVVAEVRRVLRPNGLVYAETPFLQNVHEGAYDFTRFTQSGHRWLFRQFNELAAGPLGGPASQLVWSLSYLAWSVCRSRRASRMVRLLFGWFGFFDVFIDKKYRSDSATGTYFLGRRSEGSLKPRDIVDRYPGAQ